MRATSPNLIRLILAPLTVSVTQAVERRSEPTASRCRPRPIREKRLDFRLDLHSGVPVYRQIIDQVMGGIAAGAVTGGDQLPTVRQVAVDLSINPNTVVRAYRELEIRGVLETQQGTGTFVSHQKVKRDEVERERQLNQLVSEFVSRAGSAGFTVKDLLEQLNDRQNDTEKNRR